MSEQLTTLRLNKWLWAARFFKTRQLAVEAINGGKVHLNGQRTNPGTGVQLGIRLRNHKGSLAWDIEVAGINKMRRPASEAVLLYRESWESKARPAQIVEEQRLLKAAEPQPATQPSRRDWRMIHRFIQKDS